MKRNWMIIPELDGIEEFVELAREYDAAFEYNDFYAPYVYEDEAEVKRRMAAYLALDRDRSRDTLHGAFLDVVISSQDSFIAEYSRKRVHQSMEIASELGVKGVIFHSGLVVGVNNEIYIGNWLNRQESLIRELVDEFPGINIYMENTHENNPDKLLMLADRLKDCKEFSFCFDYAHANISGLRPGEWIDAMKKNISHIHINDNDGVYDLHEVPGKGVIDWKRFDEETRELSEASVLIEIKGLKEQRRALEYLTKI